MKHKGCWSVNNAEQGTRHRTKHIITMRRGGIPRNKGNMKAACIAKHELET
jgi:hypothetical protein